MPIEIAVVQHATSAADHSRSTSTSFASFCLEWYTRIVLSGQCFRKVGRNSSMLLSGRADEINAFIGPNVVDEPIRERLKSLTRPGNGPVCVLEEGSVDVEVFQEPYRLVRQECVHADDLACSAHHLREKRFGFVDQDEDTRAAFDVAQPVQALRRVDDVLSVELTPCRHLRAPRTCEAVHK